MSKNKHSRKKNNQLGISPVTGSQQPIQTYQDVINLAATMQTVFTLYPDDDSRDVYLKNCFSSILAFATANKDKTSQTLLQFNNIQSFENMFLKLWAIYMGNPYLRLGLQPNMEENLTGFWRSLQLNA